ncbi:MAG: aspartate aminotransferase family protein [Alphaproteobacteria bacterium]|nr:aspartate aminotransferase family protein [Alphaproteobacteria bacterium SS10]
MPTYNRTPLAFERGDGAYLFATDGEKYLDFAAGIAVNALGHNHPHLVATLKDQGEKLWHVSNLYRIPEAERLAARLTAATFADTMFFTNSGAEAWECGVKVIRKYFHHKGQPDRYRIICLDGAFHGRTLAGISATRQAKMIEGFAPLVDGFDVVPFGDLAAIEDAIGPNTAAIHLEPVQGEGGIRPLDPEFLKAVRGLCDQHDLLLYLDEVQCGMGRTGRLFAHEWAGITPDVMCAAKGIGGGFPLGACLTTAEAASGMVAGTHGSTYGGNPLATAIGNAVLDVMLEPGFLDQVVAKGKALQEALTGLHNQFPVIETVRGKGLMLGIKLKDELPAGDLVQALRDQHLLTVPASDNTVRILPPLTIEQTHIDEAVAAIAKALGALSQ